MADQTTQLIKDLLPEILNSAGKIALDFKSKGFEEKSKGKLDFVTEADLAVDKFLQVEIKKNFPQSDILTEETAPDNYLLKFKSSESLWIIDPIDGTTNFARNFSNWAISVAYVSNSETIAAFVYKPEEQKLYSAFFDEEYAYLNGKKLTISKVDSLSNALMIVGWSWEPKKRELMYEAISKFYLLVRATADRGSAASDMCLVAEGNADVGVIFGVKPWDVAASNLILTKSGGIITKSDGSKWNLFDPDYIMANSKSIHDQIITLLNN